MALIDPPVWAWMIEHRTPALTSVATVVTAVGSTVGMTVLATVDRRCALVRKGRRSDAILVAVVGLGAGVLVRVGKATVGRERPPVEFRLAVESSESFPSGHALASAAILGVVAVVLLPLLRRVWARLLLLAGVVAVRAGDRADPALPGRALGHRRAGGLGDRADVALPLRHGPERVAAAARRRQGRRG